MSRNPSWNLTFLFSEPLDDIQSCLETMVWELEVNVHKRILLLGDWTEIKAPKGRILWGAAAQARAGEAFELHTAEGGIDVDPASSAIEVTLFHFQLGDRVFGRRQATNAALKVAGAVEAEVAIVGYASYCGSMVNALAADGHDIFLEDIVSGREFSELDVFKRRDPAVARVISPALEFVESLRGCDRIQPYEAD